MLDSTHASQLQESLHDIKWELEQSQASLQQSERSCRQLESQLEESKRKYDEILASKMRVEDRKLDLELQVGKKQSKGCMLSGKGHNFNHLSEHNNII